MHNNAFKGPKGESKRFDDVNISSKQIVIPYMIVCLYGVLRRRLQSRTGAGEDGASSFTL